MNWSEKTINSVAGAIANGSRDLGECTLTTLAAVAESDEWKTLTPSLDELTFLGILADIRKKTGIGDKVMLHELADTLQVTLTGFLRVIESQESEIDRLKRQVVALRDGLETIECMTKTSKTQGGIMVWAMDALAAADAIGKE